jgi:hypothetical protein
MPGDPPVTNTNLLLLLEVVVVVVEVDGELLKDWTKQQEITKRRRATRTSLGRCNMMV